MTSAVATDSSGSVTIDEAMSPPAMAIPVLRPRLPTADQLAPYLARIDQSRVYSNFGPLAAEFERRLGMHFALEPDCAVSAGSGYAALVGAILACTGRAPPQRCLAVVPAFTFIATAAAVEHCGYTPWLADVDATTWMLDPERLLDDVDLDHVGLVVPVATLGRPVPVDAWRRFHERTGIAVVIDGAASFDALADAPKRFIDDTIPVVVSFHATKTFATGEGGCVLARDPELIARATRALNFGFLGSRDCGSASLNGKLSEYHAAVGLAEFDHWPDKQAAIHAVAASYRRAFRDMGLEDRFHGAPDVGGCYSLFHAGNEAEAQRVCAALRAGGIDYRFWYGQGLHRHGYYADALHEDLAVTGILAATLIGLPFAPDLDDASIARIVVQVHAGITGA
jgi:dTDP-4-amino-4,6-dideoxygalactose transaminase